MGANPEPMRGQGGSLDVRAELIAGRTRFTQVVQRPPLGISRALHPDPHHPRMASAMLTSAAGGVLQGDVLQTRIEVGDGAWLHLGTQSATRFYRMPAGRARVETRYAVGAGAWLEVIPDPWIPYAGAVIEAHTACDVDPTGVLVVAEIVAAGRAASGERLAYERVESVVDIAVGGVSRARDVLSLVPADGLGRVGRLGPFAAVGSLLVVARGVRGETLADAAEHTEGAEEVTVGGYHGAGDLPGGAGAWLRTVAPDGATARAVIAAAWTAARAILGAPPPPLDRRG